MLLILEALSKKELIKIGKCLGCGKETDRRFELFGHVNYECEECEQEQVTMYQVADMIKHIIHRKNQRERNEVKMNSNTTLIATKYLPRGGRKQFFVGNFDKFNELLDKIEEFTLEEGISYGELFEMISTLDQ